MIFSKDKLFNEFSNIVLVGLIIKTNRDLLSLLIENIADFQGLLNHLVSLINTLHINL